MALTKFKYIKIKLDRADMTITQQITAKVGAVNGNGIELQIVNGSIIEDTTGVAVYLNWKHQTAGNQGSEPFTLVDATNGIYRVTYPTELLNAGLVDADIKIVDGTSITMTTQPILIKVAAAATSSTVQSANAWNDIQTILVTQQAHNARLVTLENPGGVINSAAAKTTPVENDMIGLMDSAAGNILKKLSWANIKATLKSYFDSLYPSMTTGNLTYYVSPTGSNSNNGTSAGTPFQTITYALSRVPRNIRHTVTINVAAGTYSEVVVLAGFFGEGTLTLSGGSDLTTAVNYKVNRFSLTNDTCNVVVQGFETVDASNNAVQVWGCTRLNFNWMTSTVSATSNQGFYIEYSKVYIYQCLISNRNYALYAHLNSDVYSSTWTAGSGNNIGLVANAGAKISKISTQPQGTTSESVTNAGMISSSILNPAPLKSPAFTDTPTAPTAAVGTNTTQIATTAFVKSEVAALVASSPTTLDTLNELAAALGNDPNFATTMATQLGLKANKSTELPLTLSAASWVGSSAPFTYALTATGVTTTSNQELLPSTAITDVQLAALQAANVQDAGQAANTMNLKAFGTKPTVDIPIRVILRGDK